MAARTRKVNHDEKTRTKIQASQLVNRLQNHVLGKVDLSPTQVRAAEVLLKKILPDLSAAENKTEVTHKYVARLPSPVSDLNAWKKQTEAILQ